MVRSSCGGLLRPSIAVAALAVLGHAAPARAQGSEDAVKQACVGAYDATQTRRQEGALRAAREQAIACSQERCPAVVKKDCAQWLAEIEAALPRVSFAVKDRTGRDTTAARVIMDGNVLLERVDAQAVPVDPGQRTFRVEIEGEEPLEQRVIVREGEKGRVIDFSFADAAGASRSAAPMQLDEDTGGGGVPAASWILGGVGVVGVGLFATFGALGLSEKGGAEDPSTGCAPTCADDEVDSIRTKFLVADVSLGVGVAALGAAVIIGLVAAGEDEEMVARQGTSVVGMHVSAAPTFGVDGRPRGGVASISGSF
jgi:hypothetical protein